MPNKTFKDKYEEGRKGSYYRLVEKNYFNFLDNPAETYAYGSNTNGYYIKKEFFLKSLMSELSALIVWSGITQSEIKENFLKIATDVLETLQQHPRYISEMQEKGCIEKGILDVENKYALSNEKIHDPNHKNGAYYIFGVERERAFFNEAFNPDQGIFTINSAMKDMDNNASQEEIKKALFTIGTVKKFHDSRPFFGRPARYNDEEYAIEENVKKLRAYGLTSEDIDKVFDSTDEELQNTVDAVCHNRFEVEKGLINQEDYSRANFEKLSPYNLHVVHDKEAGYLTGVNGAKHACTYLNAYIAAKAKYESAGLFTRWFNKDYRELKKSIDAAEKYLTDNKTSAGQPRAQMFTKRDLRELANRQEPLSIHKDIEFLNRHNIKTYETENVPEEQGEIQQNNQVIDQPNNNLNLENTNRHQLTKEEQEGIISLLPQNNQEYVNPENIEENVNEVENQYEQNNIIEEF